jgi:hypothetical protein
MSWLRRLFGPGGEGAEGREYALPYIDHLIINYENLDVDRGDPRVKAICDRVEAIRAKRVATPWQITGYEIFTIERAVLGLMPAEELRRRVPFLRDKFRLDVGAAEYAVYLASAPPDPATATAEELRADLARLLDELHWQYMITPVREQIRSRITLKVSKYLLAIGVVGAFYGMVAQRYCPVAFSWLAPLTAFMGAAGAFVSLQQRIQSLPSSGDPILNIFALKEGLVSVYLAPVSGALFAGLAYLLFVSGYLNGEIFPKFGVTGPPASASPTSTMTGYLRQMEPTTPADLAKLLIWGFIAGFAERLIPDTLNRLIVRRLDAVLAPATPVGVGRLALQEAAREQAQAQRAATETKEEADKRAAAEKAAAEAEATRKKMEAETRAAEQLRASPDEQATLAERAAAEKAAAEAEATRKKMEAETRAAEEKAAAEAKAEKAMEEAVAPPATAGGRGPAPPPPTDSAKDLSGPTRAGSLPPPPQ